MIIAGQIGGSQGTLQGDPSPHYLVRDASVLALIGMILSALSIRPSLSGEMEVPDWTH